MTGVRSEYNMNHSKRGHAIIFNHINFYQGRTRQGSQKDCDALCNNLMKLGFEVQVHKDLSCSGVKNQIITLANKNHTDCDCVMVVVLSHGNEGDNISALDGEYHESELWKPFLPDNCPSLAGKPKLFILQACRGKQLDNGCTVEEENDRTVTDDVGYRTAVTSDFLVAYSSVKGYTSWRDPNHGSWFIQSFCKVLQEEPNLDLLSMLVKVNKKVALEFESHTKVEERNQKKQVSQFVCTLTGNVVFKQEPVTLNQNIGLNNSTNGTQMSMDVQSQEDQSTPGMKKARGLGKSKPKDNLLAIPGSTLAARNKEDQHDVFARNVATKLRQLPLKQRNYAEKIINDALSKAELGRLKENCNISLPQTRKGILNRRRLQRDDKPEIAKAGVA